MIPERTENKNSLQNMKYENENDGVVSLCPKIA